MDKTYRNRIGTRSIPTRDHIFCPQTEQVKGSPEPKPPKNKDPERGSMEFLLRSVLAVALGLFLSSPSHAYVRTMSSAGNPLTWSSPSLSLFLNPVNSSGLSSAQVTNMIQGAFQSWVNTGAGVSFNVNSSTGNSTASSQDYVSRVFFTSNSSARLDYGVIAVTQVYYRTSSGQIVESDMIFNDTYFQFTNTAGDTGTSNKIYLQDVATHEAGHAYGLDHSTVNRSTLVYRAFSGQYTLGNDDSTAINTIYPGNNSGGITGSVQGIKGGMFGVHILAINASTGKVQAGVLADTNGNFRIGNIPPGDYVVEMEPLYASTATISSYYQNIDHRFCGGSRFGRKFYGSCGNAGEATLVNVGSGDTGIGTLAPSCNSMGNPGGTPTNLASARAVSNSGGAYYGTLGLSSTHYYKVTNFSGDLNIKAMSWSLFSPLDPKVEILQSDGSALAGATSTDNVENPMPGGKVNYDSSASATGLANGNYIIKVTSGPGYIGGGGFPAGSEFVDGAGFYLLLVNANGSNGTASITDMSSCISVNNVIQSASSTPAPTKTNGGDTTDSGGGCAKGSLAVGGNDEGGGPPFYTSSLFLILAVAMLSRIYPILAPRRRRR